MLLVTGGAGFIGSKLAEHFINNGEDVVVLDNLSTGYLSNIPKGAIFVQGDVFDPNVYQQIEQWSFDGIFHIAGQASGEVSFENPTYDLKTNTLSTLLLLEFAKKKGVKKFIFTSSMSVYGDSDAAVIESSTTNPKSFYAVGKLASEQYLKIFTQFGIFATVLRLFNVYGPGQNMENLKQGMVSIFLAQALENRKIVVKGSGERFRDFIFIDDVIESLILAYHHTQKPFSIYNICTGKKNTINSLLEVIKNELPFPVEIAFSGNTLGDQFGLFGNNDLAKLELKFSPKTPLEQGIKQTVETLLSSLK